MTRRQAAGLINPLLFNQINHQLTTTTHGTGVTRVVIQNWFDDADSATPFDLPGLTVRDYTSYLAPNVKKNGIPLPRERYT